MELFTPVTTPEASVSIDPGASIISIGSCFAETTAEFLNRNKFTTLYNPFGTLYNPHSIAAVILHAIQGEPYTKDDLYFSDGKFISFAHSTKFSGTDPDQVLKRLNESDEIVRTSFQNAKLCILTLGTARVWKFTEQDRIVGNCHKIDNRKFTNELLSPSEVVSILANLVSKLTKKYPNLTLIFSVSPVRYLRDSLVENSRSKGVLLYAIGELIARFPQLVYFPSFEIMMDELRDYRFYDESMIEPSMTAKKIILERFANMILSKNAHLFINQYRSVLAGMSHRISKEHDNSPFIESNLKKIRELSKQFPLLDFNHEMDWFKSLA